MSEIKSENFSMRKSEPTVHVVKPCFCCSIKHESYYNFINIWDIISFCLAITGSIMEVSIGRLAAGVGLFLNIVLLMMVLIAYVIYYNQNNYGLFIHKFYSTTRLVFVCIELLAVVVMFIVAFFIRLPRHVVPFRWAIILGIVVIGLFVGLNLYWSLLFMKVVSRRSRMENGQVSEEEPPVMLESELEESELAGEVQSGVDEEEKEKVKESQEGENEEEKKSVEEKKSLEEKKSEQEKKDE